MKTLAAGLALATLLLAPAPPAQADMYECRGASGNVTMRNRPCASSETQVGFEATRRPSRPAQQPAGQTSQPNANDYPSSGQPSGQPGANYGQTAPNGAAISMNDPRVQAIVGNASLAMAQDPDLMRRVMDLQYDPNFKAIFADPALLQRLQAGEDMQGLAADPRIQAVMDYPIVRELMIRGGYIPTR